ncbi:LysR family transcriptional regulator [Neobacillus cucumis]|uniref:LysR family transcriptional regulator n=1 Tax=Neobacillus cucumis TaxID=1740721 RepID=UPI0018E0146C|nr:LysR family transcriptional regulator [Neobacillus cucumis]MBI0578001.1 LysR family transcriptional regulator [Neobacillus cucumis]
MNIEQIEAFIFVAVTRSFSKAGEALFTTQPTVSARIKALENSLNCQLFYRTGNTVNLTKEGSTFLPYAKDILHSLKDGQYAIQREQLKLEGEIEISAVFVAAFHFLPDLMKEFHLEFPQVKVNLYTGHSTQVLDMVLNHQVTFGIARAVNHPKIESIHLFHDEMILAIYPEHPFGSREAVTMEELAREEFILYNRNSIDWTLIHNAFDHLQLQKNVIMETDNIEVVNRMVKQKIGIAILPKSAIGEELNNGTLIEVKVANLPYIQRDYELIYLKDRSFDRISESFLDFLVKGKESMDSIKIGR